MNRYIYILVVVFSLNVSAQSKDEIIKTKDAEILKIKEISSQSLANALKLKNINLKLSSESDSLRAIIKETNFYFLKEMFEDTYNDKYFKTRDLAKIDDSENFKTSTALINSVMVDAVGKTLTTCNKVRAFNSNYLQLLLLRDNVLNKKYEEKNVSEAIAKINALPKIDENSSLGTRKKEMYDLLFNYKENTCTLKTELDLFKNMGDQKAISKSYDKLASDIKYKNYPYLVEIIKEMKVNVNSYTGADDLIPCITEAETKKIEENKNTEKIEVLKPVEVKEVLTPVEIKEEKK